MKKSFYTLLVAALFSLGSLCAHGAEATAQAIVLKLTGTAHMIIAGQAEPSTLKVGDKLPQGATIVTDANSVIDVQAFNGAVATIKPGSSVNLEKLSVTTSGGVVTKQTALLDLKVGTILSSIDPANHNINDYGIRTPKGVAAARGTAYVVAVGSDGSTTVTVTESVVTFYNPATGQSVKVAAGNQVSIDKNGVISQVTPASGTAEGKTVKVDDNTDANPSTVPEVSTDVIQSQSH